jgi:hypothetical protein
MTRLHIPRWFIVDAPIFVAGPAGFAVLIVAWAYLQHFKEDPRCEPWCKTAIGIAQDMPKTVYDIIEMRKTHHAPPPKAAH